ncbi:9445_t:CDS:1, partial [Funneliformis geosporum]
NLKKQVETLKQQQQLDGRQLSSLNLNTQNHNNVQDENIQEILNMKPPSVSARHSVFFKEVQNPSSAILNHRPYKCLGPPVFFYNKVFNKFVTDFRNEDLPISKVVLEMVDPLIQDMSKGYDSEDDRLDCFEKYLRKIIWPIEKISNKDKTSSDGVVTEPVESFHESALLFLLEIKNEIGTGFSDPTIQGSLSYVRRWAQERFRDFRRSCNCPSIIIALAGPWICILGSVYLEKGIIDPLTTFIPLVPFHHYSYHKRISRLFEALLHAFDYLKNYYEGLTLSKDVNCQWFYPFPREYQDDKKMNISFTYDDWFTEDHNKFIWRATTDKQCKIVVKLAQTYNEIAHKLCAVNGFAPKLLYVNKTVVDGWWFIVMELIEGVTLCDDEITDKEYLIIMNDVTKVIHLLHGKNLVFGDLRSTNIIIRKADNKIQTMVFEFDSCGEHQISCYQPSMSSTIEGPPGAEAYALLDKSHDLYWLDVFRKKRSLLFSS